MTPQAKQEPALFSTDDTARYLSISKVTLYRLTASGKLSVVKIGRRKLYRKTDLDAFVASLVQPVAA